MDLDPVEVRVLGCLIEKQRVTPDAYPLSLNALRLACNQTTNRVPVVQYDEETIRAGLHRLSRRRWTRLASGHSSRAAKYRHLLDEALGLEPSAMATMAVLMLRGDQTPGELKQRTERMHAFAGLEEVEATLDGLVERGLVARLARRPGQKEERYAHRLGEDLDEPPPGPGQAVSPPAERVGAPPAPAPAAVTVGEAGRAAGPPAGSGSGRDGAAEAGAARDARLDRLDAEVAGLREEVAALRADLAALRADLGA